MKQISNWIFGSFFRTIGRLLVFIVLGIIVAHFIDFGSIIDNFSITNLFFDKVNASSYGGYRWINNYYPNQDLSGTVRGSEGLFSYVDVQTSSTYNANYVYNFNYFASQNLTGFEYGSVQWEFSLDLPQIYVTQNSTIYGSDYCNRWDWSTIDSYNNVTRWDCDRVSNSQDSTVSDREYIYPKYSLKAYLMYGSNNLALPCEVNWNTNRIKCDLGNDVSDIHGLRIDSKVFYMSNNTSNYRIRFGKEMITYKNDEANINSSINSQSQQQHSDHQETQSYLEDSNTTQAENDASNFFSGFSVNLGGLTGIITAPLNTIQSLLNSSCTNLVLPLPFVNKNLTLPCMNDIYTEHFGLFFSLYQTIILGIIAYRCIMSIFFDIKGFTNPDDDRIEVMDL